MKPELFYLDDSGRIKKATNNNHKGRVYYFKLYEIRECSLDLIKDFVFEQDGQIYIRFIWELAVLFATHEQLVEFDAFRQKHVGRLLAKHCNIECTYRKVGSNSPKSDIDLNMSAPHVEKRILNMIDEHNSIFSDSLESMFDTNLYGITMKSALSVPEYDSSNERQLIWSFVRIAEVVQKHPHLADTIPQKKLLEDATNLLVSLQKKYRMNRFRHYAAALKRYYQNEILENMSLAAYFEKDSYRSSGAFLHIVEKAENIGADKLCQSIYDNHGFLLTVLTKETICPHTNIIKASKYIDRICDAINRIEPQTDRTFLTIWKLANQINTKRKQFLDTTLDVKKLMKFIKNASDANRFFLHLSNCSK